MALLVQRQAASLASPIHAADPSAQSVATDASTTASRSTAKFAVILHLPTPDSRPYQPAHKLPLQARASGIDDAVRALIGAVAIPC